MKQRKDKGLRWWAFFRFTRANARAIHALQRLNRIAKETGCHAVEIQSGIAADMLKTEYDADAEEWSLRKAFGMYERRGLPVPRECLEAELRHYERLERAGAK